jgi:hypothetical protein
MNAPRTCVMGRHLKPKRALYDARMIFLAYVCDACEEAVQGRYRPDVLTDPNYWHDEPIEPD